MEMPVEAESNSFNEIFLLIEMSEAILIITLPFGQNAWQKVNT